MGLFSDRIVLSLISRVSVCGLIKPGSAGMLD